MKVKLKTLEEEKIMEMSKETFKTFKGKDCPIPTKSCEGCKYEFFCKGDRKEVEITEVKEMKNEKYNLTILDLKEGVEYETACGLKYKIESRVLKTSAHGVYIERRTDMVEIQKMRFARIKTDPSKEELIEENKKLKRFIKEIPELFDSVYFDNYEKLEGVINAN